jgi:hypothetical protein
MAGSRFVASAAVVGLMALGMPAGARAQSAAASGAPPGGRVASFAPGAILGVVYDERGAPVPGVVISALGSTTTVAVTDKSGRFEFGTLSPGPYLVRAHLGGYTAARAQTVQVRPGGRETSTILLRRADATPQVLAAGLGLPIVNAQPVDDGGSVSEQQAPDDQAGARDDDRSETAWRIRHARRGILKDAVIPAEIFAADDQPKGGLVPIDFLGRAMGTPARAATSFFADTPFSGQVNLLTTGSFDGPQRLFSADNFARNIAYVRVGAPVGDQADWTVRGALTQSDISAWIIAGSYSTRAFARHRYDVGLSYSTQQYEGGNPLALRDLADGTRNVGTVYAYDGFTLTPALTFSYGGSFARYDYLDDRTLISPRAEITLSPTDHLRFSAAVSRRALAPGAEEFLPPGETGIWLPPQRTFSSIEPGQPFEAERTTHVSVGVERDLGRSTLVVRGFRQHVDDQLLTVFGESPAGEPAATLGHYRVGNAGSADATGCSVELRTVVGGRVHGSLEYSLTNAELIPRPDVRYLLVLEPTLGTAQSERIHDVSASVETDVPETATRVLVLYRVGNGFAGRSTDAPRHTGLDGRFDVQVRQSLPFMNFSNARWEMLVAVRNFFREAVADQSVFDELLVVRPPKRLVGGVTLHF